MLRNGAHLVSFVKGQSNLLWWDTSTVYLGDGSQKPKGITYTEGELCLGDFYLAFLLLTIYRSFSASCQASLRGGGFQFLYDFERFKESADDYVTWVGEWQLWLLENLSRLCFELHLFSSLKELKKGVVALWTSLFYRLGNTATPIKKTVSVWCRKQANWEAALGRSSSAAHRTGLLSSCRYTARSAVGSEPLASTKAPQQTQQWGAGSSLDAMDILSPLTNRNPS